MLKLVPYGEPARAALRELILTAKQDRPLAPVTVIVPSNYAGLATRRALASNGALANVRFQGAPRLAELLGAPSLIARGRRPLTNWVRIQAVRAALKRRPGVFSAVANHPATARELQRTFAELREVSETALGALAASGPRPADVVALYREFRALTRDYFDEVDLLDAAADALEAGGPAAAETGVLVLYLPRRLSPSLVRLLSRAADTTGAHAIFGLTGDEDVDAATRALAERLPALGQVESVAAALPPVARVISVTDAEEEVREAARQAMALAAEGVGLHRIAFAYANREVYAGLLDDALNSAGVPHNSSPNNSLATTLAGRTVLGLPRIAASSGARDPGYARDVVMDWLTSAPIWQGGREAPSHRWDEISRDARIVAGPKQWYARLETYAANQDLEAEERGAGDDSVFRRNARWARELRQFIETLERHLGFDNEATHADHARRALTWLNEFLPERALDGDEAQLDARERVKHVLEEIVALGQELPTEMDPLVRRAEFASALEEALSEPFGRHGKLGEGVFCGPVSSVGEMDFDAVIVLGMVEGAFPAGSRDDPILTAEERARTGGELPPGGQPPTESRRAYLAALHAASSVRMVSAPRADVRRQRSTQPSRWLLEAASVLNGERLYTTDLENLLTNPPAWFRVVHSFESAVRNAPEPASEQEWDLGSLLRYHGRHDRHFLFRAPEPNPLRRGREARTSRGRRGERRMDAWIGRVAEGAAPVPGVDRPISPTSLEEFAKCPFRYFLGKVLNVGEVEKPEEIVTIEPATIGSIVHEVLQHFFEATKDRFDPNAEWTGDERATLERLARQTFEEFERKGLTGRALTWQAEQKRILRDLELLLDRELLERRQTGYRFKLAEAAFGVEPRASRPNPLPPATFRLSNGETISFRGVVDRVDEGPNGELLITDYKTGSTRSYEALTPENPLKGGHFLQLPVYALAFRDENKPPVKARYWFISEQADFVSKEVELNDALYERFGETINALVETMRAGYFPAVPGEEDFRYGGSASHENCRYCPYDQLCPSSSRLEMWQSAKTDPALAGFVALSDIAGKEPSDD